MYTRLFSFFTKLHRTQLLISSSVISITIILLPMIVDAAQSTNACSTWTSYLGNLGFCLFNDLFALIGATIMSLGALLLYFAGTLLDNVVYYGIVNFGSQYEIIKPGIEQVWTIIRDFANIGIIGAFVFVAISTILSIDQYSVKNFVAKLLIAAVLINFSLFFTKAAFDVSNMTATVFANAIGATKATTDNVTIAASGGNVNGFSGAFLHALGISGTFDVTVLKNAGLAANTSWMALITGVLMFFFLTLTAIVFFYASFLVLTRVVIIIFLLMISAGAFAARAIPTMGKYWDDWRTQLMHSAFFAPLLMMFLWAVMVVAKQLTPTSAENLAGMIQQTTANGSGLVSFHILFNFGIIIGLLIVAIKAAGTVAEYTATYATFRTGTNKGMGYLDRGVGILKGTPKGAWNAWDYWSSKRAYERVEKGDWKPNFAQRTWATTRGFLFGGKEDVLAKMEKIKEARLRREAAGKVGYTDRPIPGVGKSVAELTSSVKDAAKFYKGIAEKGMGEGGYEKMAEKKKKDEITKEAKLSDAERFDALHTELAKGIQAAFTNLERDNPDKATASGLKDAIKEMTKAVTSLENLKASAKPDMSIAEKRDYERQAQAQRRAIAENIERARKATTSGNFVDHKTMETLVGTAKTKVAEAAEDKLAKAIAKRISPKPEERDPVKEYAMRRSIQGDNERTRWATYLKTGMEDTKSKDSGSKPK